MPKLPEFEIEKITSLLKEGKPLPDNHKEDLIQQLEQLKKSILFDTKKEYELIYADKEREVDILADTMAVPLQKVKTFRNGTNGKDWTNMLVFGDNLQVLKALLQMKQEGKLKNTDGTPGIRLVYIDPPFGTGDEYDAKGAPAYSARVQGAKYVEFIRKRAILIRELMAEDSIIYVRIDYHFIHPIKLLLDEIFDSGHFINELIINRRKKSAQETLKYNVATDSILVYTKGEGVELKKTLRQRLCSFCNQPVNPSWHDMVSSEIRYPPERTFFGKKKLPPRNMHFTYTQDRIDNMIIENRVRIDDTRSYVDLEGNRERGMPQYLQSEETPVDSNWMDLKGYTSRWNYPTENSEELLERIVKSSSNLGDLVLDCFAGSGSTLAVAEKMGRRWLGVDCGKLAIYTMQKRLLNIADSKDLGNLKKKYGKPCKPFTLYNAGLYDYKKIKELPWEQYRDFALKLFQCRDNRHEISKIELDGYLGADSVMVFNYQKHPNAMLDRGFIDDLHKYLGNKVGRRFFIIAPAASVRFLEDYIEQGKTKYFVLRIPYSIIEEIHNRGFTKIKQPVSEMDVNDTVDAVGFDFIQVPTVECKYFIQDKKGQLKIGKGTKECVIKIEKFESKVISRKPLEFANLGTLSMVMLDYDFDGEVFDLDEVFYAEELKKNDYEVRFAVEDKIKEQIMVIYIDIFGNEKREIKTLSDFNGKRKK
jgi:site-specific DNA-methyltransferase (adenine-specific)/adenine-specific DNA-methyltransferase